MAKVLLVCHRDPDDSISPDVIRRACNSLAPDGLPPETRLLEHAGLAIGISRANPAVRIHDRDTSIGACLGHASGDGCFDVGETAPSGTYALLRADADRVQLVSDAVASRTLWYAQDERRFVAATSQRALVRLLRSFEPEPAAVPWMIATGTLGPHAWDRRLRRLPGDAVLTLDRRSWTVRTSSHPVEFHPATGSAAEHEARLHGALVASIGSMGLDARTWALPLSGGYDSRGILCLLSAADRRELRTLTWGLASARDDEATDAWVARRLAGHFEMPHRYFETDVNTDLELASVIERVLVAGEGRTDAIAAYMDGFAIWRTLVDGGIHGVIRGDEGFGWIPVVSERDVRLAVGLPLAADFANVTPLLRELGGERSLHASYERAADESLPAWRDRLYHEFRIPAVLAALSDLKLPYVELVNPLLSHEIVRAVRRVPDELRTDKRLFRRIVDAIAPPIPYATRAAIAAPRKLVASPAMIAFLRDALASEAARRVLPRASLEELRGRLEPPPAAAGDARRRRGPAARLRSLVPRALRDRLRGSIAKPSLSPAVLAFRIHVAAAMTERLASDARAE